MTSVSSSKELDWTYLSLTIYFTWFKRKVYVYFYTIPTLIENTRHITGHHTVTSAVSGVTRPIYHSQGMDIEHCLMSYHVPGTWEHLLTDIQLLKVFIGPT